MADELHEDDAGEASISEDERRQEKKRKRWRANKRQQRASAAAKKKPAPEPEPEEDELDDDEEAPELDDDPEYQAFREQFEQPLENWKDLAAVLAKLHAMAAAVTEEYPRYRDAAAELDAIDLKATVATGELQPNKRARMIARMIWPWMEEQGGLASLAYLQPGTLALLGVAMFAGPAAWKAWQIHQQPAAAPRAPEAQPQADVPARDQTIAMVPKAVA